jgi:hypothetical protein
VKKQARREHALREELLRLTLSVVPGGSNR